ncbi:MAG: autotransporter outer membrane beta-barrel domain-containing protein, partial [Hydrogenophaga sp.]
MPQQHHAHTSRKTRWAAALIAGTFFPLSALAQIVTYTFAQGSQTELTNGAYITGSMTVDYSLVGINRVTSANLTITAPSSISFGIGDLAYFDTFSNTVCGVSRSFEEANFNAGGYNLYLDVEQSNTSAPVPGNTGVHTSLRDPGFALHTLANSCTVYNNPTPPTPSGNGVYASADNQGNTPGLNAARVIDATPALAALFNGLGSDASRSDALSQTLPLLTGGSHQATRAALTGVNNVVQARAAFNRGLSSGDGFAGNRNVWMKPFGTWAKQDDSNGVSGYGADVLGMVGGVDMDSKTALKWGAALAYARSQVKSNSVTAAQRANVNMLQFIGYGTYQLTESTDIRFQADAGRNATKGQRTIAFTSTVAASQYDSNAVHLGVALDRHFALGP